MRAFAYDTYGPPEVLQLTDVTKPTPGERELLIKVCATTVTAGDCRVRGLRAPTGFGWIMRLVLGMRRPRQPVLGSELSGRVEAVGPGVGKFKVGDEVFAFSDIKLGCHAEYRCLHEDAAIATIPPGLGFEAAAAMSFGGTTALHFLRKAKLRRGDTVLVNGASGSVGTAAVQLAKHFGAAVTAVCSAANADLAKSLGAEHVIDYTREDFARSGKAYDVIVDAVGTAPYRRSKAALKPEGRLLLLVAGLPDMLMIPWLSATTRHTVVAGPAGGSADDLRYLASLVVAGAYSPVIDRVFPFVRLPEAHRYVDGGHKRGNVVIRVIDDPDNEAARAAVHSPNVVSR